MAKMGCAKCGGTKKMQKGGMKTTVANKNAKTFIAGMPNSGPTGPNYQGINTMKKGGSKFPDLTGDGKVTKADVLKGRGVIKKSGGVMKAKFGAPVSVQHSPKAGKVRSASAQGYAAVGKREPGRALKKIITKKK